MVPDNWVKGRLPNRASAKVPEVTVLASIALICASPMIPIRAKAKVPLVIEEAEIFDNEDPSMDPN